jgi:hypothetical protein
MVWIERRKTFNRIYLCDRRAFLEILEAFIVFSVSSWLAQVCKELMRAAIGGPVEVSVHISNLRVVRVIGFLVQNDLSFTVRLVAISLIETLRYWNRAVTATVVFSRSLGCHYFS